LAHLSGQGVLPVLTKLKPTAILCGSGPAVTHQQFLHHIADDLPECAELLRRFGALQVRSSGTVCGNIANASPIGDLPPVLMALASKIELTKGQQDPYSRSGKFLFGLWQARSAKR
jgi:xanthine dehydrogenase small subunit